MAVTPGRPAPKRGGGSEEEYAARVEEHRLAALPEESEESVEDQPHADNDGGVSIGSSESVQDLTTDDAEVVIVDSVDLSGSPEKKKGRSAYKKGKKSLARLASDSPGKMGALPSSKKPTSKPRAGDWKNNRFLRLAVAQAIFKNDPFNAPYGDGAGVWVQIEKEVFVIVGFPVGRATLKAWCNSLVTTYNAEGEMALALQSGQNDLAADTEMKQAMGDLADLYDQAAEYKKASKAQKARTDEVRVAGKAVCAASLLGLSSRLVKASDVEEDEETNEQEGVTSTTSTKKKRCSATKKLNASQPTSSAPLTAPKSASVMEKYIAQKERDAGRANDLAERRLELDEKKFNLEQTRQNAMLDADVATKLAEAAQKQAAAMALTASLKAAGISEA